MIPNVQFIKEKQKHPLELKFTFTELWANGVSDQTTMVTIAGFSLNRMVGYRLYHIAVKYHVIKHFLASEALYIREDQKRSKEVWQEHKSGENGSRWFPVKNLKIRDPNRVKKSKANQQPTRKPNKDMKNDRSDGYSDCSSDISSDISSETLIKYATPRCLRKIRVGSSGDEVFF